MLPDRAGCLACSGELDLDEARRDIAGPDARADEDRLYGLRRDDLSGSGPSVVSINGVVASLGVTEFMCAATGLRPPNRLLRYRGSRGVVSVVTDAPSADCYYCAGIRGRGPDADVERYVRDGTGRWLR